MDCDSLPHPWAVFATLQSSYEPDSVDESLAREEALNSILEEIAVNPDLPEVDIRKRFYNLRRNRVAKYWSHRRAHSNWIELGDPSTRRGGRYRDESGTMRGVVEFSDVSDEIAFRQLALMVKDHLPRADWKVLSDLARGVPYSRAAAARGISVGTLKTRVSRIRQRVRSSEVGALLAQSLS
jgi:DNA-directed RNA polymerase specialized sigma24 family protein